MIKKAIVIPDSFKGSYSSLEIGEAMKNGIQSVYPDCEVISLPISDGGEGFVESYQLFFPGEMISLEVSGPFFNPVQASYLFTNEKVAIICLASSSGLPLAKDNLNPFITTSYGAGEMIMDAIKRGAKKVIFTIGGSSTNDAGCGVLSALGYHFINQKGETFIPTGGTLDEISSIDSTKVNPMIHQVEYVTLCDVSNPLLGENGCAFTYARQKGASTEDIYELESKMTKFASFLESTYQMNPNFPSAGAAGGISVLMKLFLNSQIQSGIETFLQDIQFGQYLENCDVIFTGEGKLDRQSLNQKVISGLAKYGKQYKVAMIAIAGQIDDLSVQDYPEGLTSAFSLLTKIEPLEETYALTLKRVTELVQNICRLL